jgi:hypothetical protein
MGFQIEISTGMEGTVIMRGCDDGTVEFCKWSTAKDKDTKESIPVLAPFQYYVSLEHAFNQIMKLRICNSKATTLTELLSVIKEIRADIHKEFHEV